MADGFPGRPRLMPGEVSRRELEVLRLVAYGATSRKAAAALHIAPSTVQDHIRNLLGRLGLHRREDAVRWAVEQGLLDIAGATDDVELETVAGPGPVEDDLDLEGADER